MSRNKLFCRIVRPGVACSLILAVIFCVSAPASAQLVINEFMASNNAAYQDPQGDYDDWIEIYNPTGAPIDLAGMYLTDSLVNLNRFPIPVGFSAQTTVPAGGHLILWADNDTADGLTHLNFALAADGEVIGLVAADGSTLIDSVVFGPQDTDVSYGRLPDGGAEWRFFSGPTPGAANSGGYIGEVADTTFSHDRGHYFAPFSLTITTLTPTATIRYTLDGSEPDEATNGITYSGPIAINTTSMVRALAFRTNWKPTNIDTHTYIFPAHVPTQTAPAGYPATWSGETADYEMDPEVYADPTYTTELQDGLIAIPTMSIVTDMNNLFGGSGIYMNPGDEGVGWERPTSIEYFDPNNADDFQLNCGIRIQGGASRTPNNSPKHSFRLLFKSDYGPTKLRFPLFGDNAADSFDTIVLRAGYNNSWIHWDMNQKLRATYIRDQFARDCQLAMGQAAAHGKFVHLYLNGMYWGLFNATERPQASFGANYYGGEKEEWDALNSSEVVDGDKIAWNTAQGIANGGVADMAGYAALEQYVDIPNLIDYMIAELYGNNADWDDHNWYSARRRIAGAGYKFFCWDTERILEDVGNTGKISINAADKPSRFYGALRQNPEFNLLFGDHLHRHFFNDGAMTVPKLAERWTRWQDEINLAIVGESARWGDYRRDVDPRGCPCYLYSKYDHWIPENDRIVNSYFPARHDILTTAFRNAGLYPTIDAPRFIINGTYQHGGAISSGDLLTMQNPNGSGTIYYTLDGSEPRIPGGGGVSPTASAYAGAVALTDTVRIKSRVLNGAVWSALNEAVYVIDSANVGNQLRITEVMYNPAQSLAGETPPPAGPFNNDDFEFVELKNTGAWTLDLAGAGITDGIATTVGLVFDWQQHVLLAPDECAVLVSNREAFESRYGAGVRVLGQYQDGLANDGERLELNDAADAPILAFIYDDSRSWPQAADGAGHSLVPLAAYLATAPTGSLYYGGNWRASTFIGGSPGQDDPPTPPGVVLNEVAAHTDFPTPPPDSNDWIELYNPTAGDIALNDCYLSDDIQNLSKWAILNGTLIRAGQFLSFDEVTHFHNPNGFGLNKDGERAVLSHLPGTSADRVLDDVRFKGQENGATLGRHLDGATPPGPAIAAWRAMAPTRGAANAAPTQDLVVNQFMYHPLGDPEAAAYEYIEIHNPAAAPVNLWNAAGAWRVSGAVEYEFSGNVAILAGGYVLLVSFDPADAVALNAFKAAYGVSNITATVVGPYVGALSNRVERFALERPQAPDLVGGAVSWVVVDEVAYFEQAPFPPAADGTGAALHRVSAARPGPDPTNWTAAPPNLDKGLIFAPLVQNQPASAVSDQAATLNGELTANGGQNPTVRIYWGTVDGGAAPGGWQQNELLGVLGVGPFAAPLAGLSVSTVYYFRAYAINSAGGAWANATATFTTTNAPPGRPSVSHQPATSVTHNSATLNGAVLDTGGEDPTVRFYWGTVDGGNIGANWQEFQTLGVRGLGPYSANIIGLTPNTTYYFQTYAFNSGGTRWAAASGTFTTAIGPATGPPAVSSLLPSGITDRAATLNGEITHTGNEDPTVTIYWGTAAGGQILGNWQQSATIGVRGLGQFSHAATGLTPSTLYFFRCYAENSAGGAWSSATGNFTTTAPQLTPPTLVDRGASNVNAHYATLNGEITDTGGEPAEVRAYWGTSDGGQTGGNWQYSQTVGTFGVGAFTAEISGLDGVNQYYYRLYAQNSDGGVWTALGALPTPLSVHNWWLLH